MSQDKILQTGFYLWSITLACICLEKFIWLNSKFGANQRIIQEMFNQVISELDCQIALVVVTVFALFHFELLKIPRFTRRLMFRRSPVFFIGVAITYMITFCALPYIYCYGGKGIAFMASNMRHYELGELVFAKTRDWRDQSTHATVANYIWNPNESDFVKLHRIKAISVQYGPNSPELARLDLERGICFYLTGHLQESEQFLTSGLRRYESITDSKVDQTYVKALLALNNFNQGNCKIAQALYEEAKGETAEFADKELTDKNVPNILADYSVKAGLNDTKELLARSRRIKNVANTNCFLYQCLPSVY